MRRLHVLPIVLLGLLFEHSPAKSQGFSFSNGTYTPLSVIASGVNNFGQIVGSLGTSGTFTSGGSQILFSVPGSNWYTSATGINDRDQIVGSYGASGVQYGFVSHNGIYVTLSDPLGGGTLANGINDLGQIVGSYVSPAGATNPNQFGFLYSGGHYTTIAVAGAIGGTFAYSINNLGQIVGSYFDKTGFHGFIYSQGIFTTLNDPLATDGTVAYGINDLGQVAGFYRDGSTATGFIYNDGIFSNVSNPSSLNTYAYGINDLGEIVGQADPTSAVPEPSTWAMLLIGFAGIGFATYRRRHSVVLEETAWQTGA
jgi:uncharacterized membrane protein